jgi:two-component system response regulator FixJ
LSERVVHLVDDDEAVRTALGRLLAVCGFTVHSYPSGPALLERAGSLAPGCILLDLRMPEMSGFDVHSHLVRRGFDFPIVYLTAHGDVSTGVQAMKRGAVDFLEKPVQEGPLLAALAQAFKRYEAYVEEQSTASVARGRVNSLTPREREVIEHVVQGRRNREIAADLEISLQTVKVHRMRGMTKLGVSTIPDLIKLWTAALSASGSGD